MLLFRLKKQTSKNAVDTTFNYDLSNVPIVPFLESLSEVVSTFRGKMQQLFGCILLDKYITPAVLFSGHEVFC